MEIVNVGLQEMNEEDRVVLEYQELVMVESVEQEYLIAGQIQTLVAAEECGYRIYLMCGYRIYLMFWGGLDVQKVVEKERHLELGFAGRNVTEEQIDEVQMMRGLVGGAMECGLAGGADDGGENLEESVVVGHGESGAVDFGEIELEKGEDGGLHALVLELADAIIHELRVPLRIDLHYIEADIGQLVLSVEQAAFENVP